MSHYTLHDPVTHMKTHRFESLEEALSAAYKMLPLECDRSELKHNGKIIRHYREGKYAVVQEWDENSMPLRQWCVSGWSG